MVLDDVKNKNDNIFDFNSSYVNEYLNSIYPGLSAKVFRTYRASFLMDQEIQKIKDKYDKKSDITTVLNELKSS